MVKAQQCMVAVRQKWQRAAVLLDWPLADSVPSVSLWLESQNIVKKICCIFSSVSHCGTSRALGFEISGNFWLTFYEIISKNYIKINLCCFLKLYHRLLRTFGSLTFVLPDLWELTDLLVLRDGPDLLIIPVLLDLLNLLDLPKLLNLPFILDFPDVSTFCTANPRRSL